MRNKETLEEAAEKWLNKDGFNIYNHYDTRPSFIAGAKWQQDKKMYSEEELELLIYNVCGTVARLQGITLNGNNIKAAFEKFKKK